MNDFYVGDVVVMSNNRFHDLKPEFYPEAGTFGRVQEVKASVLLVAWETGSTSDDDTWYIGSCCVRKSRGAQRMEEQHMTNRDWMQTLTDEEFYDAMLYVITKLSFAYTNSRQGVIEWLGSDHQKEGDA